MGFSIGIVGLPNVGKSTLFNAVTNAGAEASNYPFCTIDPNVGIVEVPDARLAALAGMHHSAKIIPTAIELVDIAGLVKGAAQGEGLGNKFLANIREVDAIAHVVRCFDDPNIVHVSGSVDPRRDIEIINLELIYADLQTAEKRLDAAQKKAKSGRPEDKKEAALFQKISERLSAGQPVRGLEFSDEEKELKKTVPFLSEKPVLYVANIAEAQIRAADTDAYVQIVRGLAAAEGAEVVVISTRLEAELAELPLDERRELLQEYGLKESGLELLARQAYRLLGLITYLTSGEKETKAWTIKNGTKAPQAAGVIHTDFEKGFIKAEVINYTQLQNFASLHEAREKGLVRQEGREYVMQDGDVVLFKFNN
ncbi:MAG: redox-regulated ATPase YchF [Candidatus Margulisbacteria bacterium]|jgi:GTP-binding protein YchF|nr:redox-regulated ATPase YchF [Candidatus Margulisiibacteriota bacterium]